MCPQKTGVCGLKCRSNKGKKIEMRKRHDPSVLTERLICSSSNKIKIFKEAQPSERGFVLLDVPRSCQRELLKKLPNREIVKVLHYLDPDKATDVLQSLAHDRRQQIIKNLRRDKKRKVEFLLKFDADTAAGMMSLDYIEVDAHATVGDVLRMVKQHERNTGKFPTILVVSQGILVGEVPGYTLSLYKKTEKVIKHTRKVVSIPYNKDENEILAMFRKNQQNKIIVLDKDNSVVGVILSGVILKVLHSRMHKSLYGFAGVREEEDIFDAPRVKVRNRYLWLILNLATAFLAASIVGLFKETISKWVILAVYMPVIAGMGGNAGTQALAVAVRGLTLKELSWKVARKVLVNEVVAGAIDGLIVGALVAAVVSFWNGNLVLGAIVGISMVANLIIAGLFGSIVPLIMKSLGRDPATSASVFVTTATDVCGFFVFLGLASVLL